MTPCPEQPASREQVLETIAALARAHALDASEVAAYLRRQPGPVSAHGTAGWNASIVNRLFHYLGGTFIFAGIGLLMALLWDDIGSAQRVILTLGVGVAAFTLGLFTARDPRYEKAATPLFLMANLLQPTGLFVFLDAYIPPSGNVTTAIIAVFSIMALQQALAYATLGRTTLLFFAFLFFYAALGPWMGRLSVDDDVIGIAFGLSMLCLAYWAERKGHGSIAPFWNFLGTGFFLAGAYQFLGQTPLVPYLALNAFMIYLSLRLSSRAMLFVSVAALLSYLSWYTSTYFMDVVGWPIALIVLGFLFLAIGGVAVRLARRISAQARS